MFFNLTKCDKINIFIIIRVAKIVQVTKILNNKLYVFKNNKNYNFAPG